MTSLSAGAAGLVALSIAMLVGAPVVGAVLARRPLLGALLDSFVLVAVGGIVALHVIPQSAALAGPPALACAAAGLFLPIALHRLDAAVLRGVPVSAARDAVLLALFCAGIFVHGLFDGAALGGASATPSLAAAVLLHQLPVGLALFTVVLPALGRRRFVVVVVVASAGTAAGALAGGAVLAGGSAAALALVQAAVAGFIVHVVTEAPPYARAEPRTPLVKAGGAAGAALAVLALVAVERLEAGEGANAVAAGLDAGAAFLSLALACAPALVLSFLLVGVLTALYPDGAPGIAGRGSRVVDAAAGVAAGLPHPLCSCAVAPLYSDLVERGASPAGARAFLVAAPELGVPAVLLSARLFALPFTAVRVAGAALLALLAGSAAAGKRVLPATPPSSPLAPRLLRGLRHGVVDAVDHVGPWFLLGIGVAALLERFLAEDALSSSTSLGHTALTAVLAVAALPLYLCAGGATPLAAVLVHKGASLGAALAFLLVAPATSLPTFSLLKRLHGARAAASFAALVVAGAFALGVACDALLPARVAQGAAAALGLHERAGAGPGALEVVSLAVLAALLGSSLLRQGVRGFLVQIMSPQHAHDGDHEHGPGCGHDHGPPVAPAPVVKARIALGFDPRGGPP